MKSVSTSMTCGGYTYVVLRAEPPMIFTGESSDDDYCSSTFCPDEFCSFCFDFMPDIFLLGEL